MGLVATNTFSKTSFDSFSVTSGGQFSTINSNFEYRENFKQSLRKYQPANMGTIKGVRPVLSAQSMKMRQVLEKITSQPRLED